MKIFGNDGKLGDPQWPLNCMNYVKSPTGDPPKPYLGACKYTGRLRARWAKLVHRKVFQPGEQSLLKARRVSSYEGSWNEVGEIRGDGVDGRRYGFRAVCRQLCGHI